MQHAAYLAPELTYCSFSPLKMNPFRKHSFLKNIWMPELAEIAQLAYDEEAQEITNDPMYLYGEAFLIKVGKKIIGVSGYFPLDNEETLFALRWHGLIPEYQGKGLSQAIIKDIQERIESTYPQAEYLTEYMPVIKEYKPMAKYFTKLGFIKEGPYEVVDWSRFKWQNYYLALNPKPKDSKKTVIK